MYRILNKIFGWDYIHWENTCTNGIARLHKAPDGTVWYYQYKITKLIKTIPGYHEIMWLTCKPDKYLTDKVNQDV